MTKPTKLLLSNLFKHNVRCDQGIDHGPVVRAWMHPPAHRILGWVSRPSNLKLEREVWRLDQLKGLNNQEIYVKGNSSISDDQTLDRFPTLINANLFNKIGNKIGLVADFVFDVKNGNIQYYLVSRSNPLIPGSSRWRLSISQIIDQQPGSISSNIESLEDIPIHKASLREELLNKSRKWKTQFQDLTYKASDRLEGWINLQDVENESLDDSFISEQSVESYDDWIDNLDIDSFQEFNTINKQNKNRNSTNDRDLDPWF